jgi:4-aminobutyrate aminotransferase-like enzyme
MVYVDCDEGGAKDLVERLSERGVDVLDLSESTVRAVVHLHITDEDIDGVIEAFEASQ